MPDPDDVVVVDLSYAERSLLARGLAEWDGPGHCTDEMARAMGFAGVADLHVEGQRLEDALEAGQPLSRRDWTRALLATEVAFASDVMGSGVEWPDTTGLDEVESLRALRAIQRRLVAVVPRRGAWMSRDFPAFRTPLTLIGYWGGPRSESWPDVRDFVDDGWDEEERIDVGLYLRRGLLARAWMGYSTCRLCGQNNGALDFTDGVYLWPEGLAHYVLDHGVRLPHDFVEHVRRRGEAMDGFTVDDSWWHGVAPRT